MRISRDHLMTESEITGFRPEMLEKAIHLLSLLEALNSHPHLTGKLALKGGTALNLFFLEIPRLSIDIDLNYIGSPDRKSLDNDRSLVERTIIAVCGREGYTIIRSPSEHAGGKFQLRYKSAVTPTGTLQLDLNYMFRIPLWPVVRKNSVPVGRHSCFGVPLMDIHEIVAGKLAALLSRHAARDFYDIQQLLDCRLLDIQSTRFSFVIYGAINRKDWRKVRADDISLDLDEMENSLLPVLSGDALAGVGDRQMYVQRLVDECRKTLDLVLPLQSNEIEFLDLLLDGGEIRPDLLTPDIEMQERVKNHPGVLWKALNVKKHKSG